VADAIMANGRNNKQSVARADSLMGLLGETRCFLAGIFGFGAIRAMRPKLRFTRAN
jgi:hypothetical protein